jgi:hypothetical protein
MHSRYAVYDFSNTYMFTRWSVVMETGNATLMKNIRFENDSWASRASLPAGQNRSWHVAVYDDYDNMVIVQGGYYWETGMQDPVYSQPLYTYDPAANVWTNKGPSKLPQKATGVWDSHDRCMIVCGGTEVVSGNTVIHGETWAWFPQNSTWVRLADMPAQRFGQCSVWDPVDDVMLVFGGRNATDTFNDIWAFDLGQNAWTVLAPVADETPLVRAFSTAVWNPDKREMVIYGGENPNVTFLSTWAYSHAKNTWTHRTSAAWALSMHGACLNGDRGLMSTFGGRYHPGNGNYEYYNNSWTYDTGADCFAAAANAPVPGPARAGSAAVYDPVSKRALVIGGSDPGGSCLGDTWSFAPGDEQWTYYSPGFMEPPALDLGENFSSLDNVVWTQDIPAGTATSMRVRTSSDNTSFGSSVSVTNGARPVQQGRFIRWNISLTASADKQWAPAILGVRFEYTVNIKPQCSGGEDHISFKRETVTLRGNATDTDGDAVTFSWTKLTLLKGTLTDADKKDASYTPLESGVHMLQLTVNDSYSLTVSPYVKVTVANRPPTGAAGPDRTCFKNETVTPEGVASDPDSDELFYNWTQPAGQKVTIVPVTALRPAVTAARAGNYSLTLKVDDGESSLVSVMNLTVLSRPPVARLEASPLHININGRVNFTASGSSDPDGNVTRYIFDFGDNNDTGWTGKPSIGYVYTRPGVFNATVRVQDDDANMSQPSAAVRITVENALPVIDASVLPSTGNISTGFRFTVSPSSYDPDGRIVSYDWSFGDGASATGTAVTHSYTRRGNYTIVLRATDDFGGTSDMTLNVTVMDRAPVIDSALPAASPRMDLGVNFKFSISARDPDGDGLTFTWRVDGKAAGGNVDSFTYKPASAGSHVVSVEVSDGDKTASHEWSVTVREAVSGPSIDLTLVLGIICVMAVAAALAFVALRRKRAP